MLHTKDLDLESNEFGRPIKALLLDDSAFDRKRIRRMTERSAMEIEFAEVPSIEAMSKQMDRSVFDLIIIDFQLPEGDGLQALDLIQNHPTNKNATKIMITGQEQTDVAVSAFRQGCHDFITKDEMSASMLNRAMRNPFQTNDIAAYNAEVFMRELQEQAQLVLASAIDSELVQSALISGMRKAAIDIGMDIDAIPNSDKTKEIMVGFLTDEARNFDFL